MLYFEDHNIVTLESNALYSERIKEYKALKRREVQPKGFTFLQVSNRLQGVNKKDTGVRLTKHWIQGCSFNYVR